MKWSDFDTNKNAFPETIRIIADWFWFVSSRWSEIGDKNKFIEQNLQPLITGTFRDPVIKGGKIAFPSPALGTLVRNLGFIDDNYNISPLVSLVAQNKITLAEYAIIILSKQRGWVSGVPKVNFLVLLCLYLRANSYCDVSEDMLKKLSKVTDYTLTPAPSSDTNRNDLLYNYIKNTELFDENKIGDKRYLTIKEEAKEIIDFIADNQDTIKVDPCTVKGDRYTYYGDTRNGVFMLDGKELPSKWKFFYPNLLNRDSPSYKYLHIGPSKYDGDISPIIYYGAPGTGKTRDVQKNIYSKYHNNNRIFTTFHQSYSYEEFVEGLKPILNNTSSDVKYQIETGVFYKACERAAILAGYDGLEDCIKDSNQNRKSNFQKAIDRKKTMLLCIDEINRGNVASIFGDLISLIEPSKRLGAGEYEMIVTLPYSKDRFGVPANLFIVGTMNTADRSIQLLDSALRRRFKFVEMAPNLTAIADEDAKKVLLKINNRIRCLLNKDNQIGHSYLVNAKSKCDILNAIVHKIIPLLEEYFYNDIDKVKFVLNEIVKDGKDNVEYPFYIKDEDAEEAYLLYSDGIDEPKSFFKFNEKIKDILDNETECENYLEHLLK
jgi:hypothetical protein